MSNEPESVIVTDEAGAPVGVVDVEQVRAAGQIVAYAVAAVAEDENAVDSVSTEWVQVFEPTELPFVLAAALSIMAKMVVGPLVTIAEDRAPELRVREQIRDAAAWAEATGGGA